MNFFWGDNLFTITKKQNNFSLRTKGNITDQKLKLRKVLARLSTGNLFITNKVKVNPTQQSPFLCRKIEIMEDGQEKIDCILVNNNCKLLEKILLVTLFPEGLSFY